MSIESKISPSGQAAQVKKQWVSPAIHVIELNSAQNGPTGGGNDGIRFHS
jgi:hypothetical protein